MKNIGEAFAFVFRDPDWLAKILIGGLFVLLSFLLIGIPVIYGYCIELLQRVRRGEQHPLPEWKDPGVKFITGLKYIVTLFIYFVPIAVIIIPMLMMLFFVSLAGSSEFTEMLQGVGMMSVIILLVIPYALFIMLLTPMISIQFAERERIGDGLRIERVLRLFGRHWQDTLLAILITFVVSFAASIGIAFFLVGILFTSFYALLIRFHLYGQIARSMQDFEIPARTL